MAVEAGGGLETRELPSDAAARANGRPGEPPPQRNLNELLSPATWQPDGRRSPELKKAIGFVQATVGDARRLLAQAKRRGVDCTTVEEELRELLGAHDVRRLKIDSAWELYTALKKTLLLIADRRYISTLLDYEAVRATQPGRWHRWADHFAEAELTRLRRALGGNGAGGQNGDPGEALHRATDRLGFLYLKRGEAGRERRAKAAQKCRYMYTLAPVLLALLVVLAVAIEYVSDGSIWRVVVLAGSAGAVGSVLSGTLKLRDELVELDDLRAFMPTMSIQPLVGAATGLVLLLVIESGAVQFSAGEQEGWALRGLLAFAAGFSEPFFLGVVQRVARVPDKRAA